MFLFLAAMVTYQSYWMLCLACFIAGSVSIPLVGVIIAYATELTTLEMMSFCVCTSFFAEALTSILVGVYFQHFKDCAVFYLVITVFLGVFLIVYAFFAKESPHFLFRQKRYSECLEHLELMGYWNGYSGEPSLPTVAQMKHAKHGDNKRL